MELQTRKEKLELLRKKLRRRKFTSLLFAFFLLGVNAFAWFVFNTQVGVEVHGNVASWDIRLQDENNELVEEAVVEVNMKPGMSTYSETYIVNNLGEVSAAFSYEVESISVLGHTINLANINDPIDYCENYYPFSVTFSSTTNTIPSLGSTNFTVQVDWDFEDSTKYYHLNDVYAYDSEFQYYTLNNNVYSEFSATPSNYLTNLNNLYLDKDDADTYFCMNCKTYETTSGHSCLEIGLLLRVTQVNT